MIVSALLATACEHGVTLSGTITVPVEVQQAFSGERPGLVRVSTSIPKTSVLDYQLAVLCEPTSAPLVLPFFHDGFGCAKEGDVRVDVLPAAAGEDLACGAQQTLWSDDDGGTRRRDRRARPSSRVRPAASAVRAAADSIDIVLTLVR